MKRLILACCMFGISTVSFAGHCPVDAKAIDEGLAKASLSDEIKADIASLRDKGMSEHKAGNHGTAEKSLAEAMRMLLTNME
jgi:hypothetical protein